MSIRLPARIALSTCPTPLHPLPRLSKLLGGPEIWVKRDDQTGLATGGNKVRKLEFVLAEAVALGCDTLVTLGGPQSNHCRQTAAAAARLGLACTLVLRGHEPDGKSGNLLLDDLLGAELIFSGDEDRQTVADRVAAEKASRGSRPYMIPLGASTGLGAVGYVAAAGEFADQCAKNEMQFGSIVVASSSAGTQAGLTLGTKLNSLDCEVLGISIDVPQLEMESLVSRLMVEATDVLGLDRGVAKCPVNVNDEFLGGGYAVVGDLERSAIRLLARTEGLLLDPVYTGRAMGGLVQLIQRGDFDPARPIVFWHTGGAAAMSAFASDLS